MPQAKLDWGPPITQPKADANIDWGPPVDSSSTRSTAPGGVKAIADAIATAEGYYEPKSRPARNNNPGNLKKDLTGKSVGFDGPLVKYATPEDGREALEQQVRLMFGGSEHYHPSQTISDIAQTYTGNDNPTGWAQTVATKLGVTPETQLKSLSGAPTGIDWGPPTAPATQPATPLTQPQTAVSQPDQGFWNTPLLPTAAWQPTSPMTAGWKAVRDMASEMSTPTSLAETGGAIALGALTGPVGEIALGLGFGALSGASMLQEAKDAYYTSGPDRWYHGTKAVIDNLMMGAGAAGAAHGFGRAAKATALADLIPSTSTATTLANQARALFAPESLSPEAGKTALVIREKMANERVLRQQLRTQFEKQSMELDRTKTVTPEIQTTLDALDKTLDNKLVKLPDAAANRIDNMTFPDAMNEIEQRLSRIYEADKTSMNATATTSLVDEGLMKEGAAKGTNFRVFDPDSPTKTYRNFSDEEKAIAYTEKNPKLNYEAVDANIPTSWKRVNYPEYQYKTQPIPAMKPGFEVFDTGTGKTRNWFETEKEASDYVDKHESFDYRDAPGVGEGAELKRTKQLWAPAEVANLIDNHLAPGLNKVRVVGPMYDIYRGLGNTLNQFQLGFSLFHLSFVTMDSMVTGVGTGIKKTLGGQISEGVSLAARSFVPGEQLVESWLKGDKVSRGILNQDPAFANEMETLTKAGGTLRQDPFYQVTNDIGNRRQQAIRAWRDGNKVASFGKWLMAAPELFAYPVMENIIPRVKVGLFMDMAKYDMEKLARRGASDWEVRAAISKAWDSVDNRMGQIVYDNLFWPKFIKELGMASIRSLGWNIGTIREIGGGIKDLLEQPFNLVKGRNPELTWKATYAMTLPFVVGLYGGLMHYAMSGKAPEGLDDTYFPMDSSGVRHSLPSYMKDVVEAYNDPIKTARNKLHPMINIIHDTLTNRDFRNVHLTEENLWQDIKDQDGQGVVQGLTDYLSFFGKQLSPFGLTNYSRLRQQGESPTEAASSFVGFPAAPMSAVGSKFERAAKEMISAGSPEGGRSQSQAARSTARLSIEDRLRSGLPANQALQDAASQGLVSNQDLMQIMKDVQKPTVQALGEKLSPPDFVQAFNLATDDEKQQLMQIIQKKFDPARLNNMPSAMRDEALRAFSKLKWPQSKPLPPAPPPG